MGDNEINNNTNTRQMLAISIAMWMRWCDVGHIAQWNSSRALLEATGCRHRASACIALPRRPPWSKICAPLEMKLLNVPFYEFFDVQFFKYLS